MSINSIELRGISKSYGNLTALGQLDLTIKKNEILTLLGPSGCGKTTLMRIIAGFETPTTGQVLIDGKDTTNLAPEQRPVNMVFQKYALFPHLDVFDNVAFGLRLKKLPKAEIRIEVEKALEMVQLSNFKSRWISELSGGQAQRVALARALVNSPAVLLLDEPLAALDLKIRHHMLEEIKRIHEESSTTFVYVTHDQDEAMILSDRVVLLNKGGIEQIGEPEEMYWKPKTLFTAKFFGDTNIVNGSFDNSKDSGNVVALPFGEFKHAGTDISKGPVNVSIRPETISLRPNIGNEPALENECLGVVKDTSFIGNRVIYRVSVGSGDIELKCQQLPTPGSHTLIPGTAVSLNLKPDSFVVLSA
ncbi:ABC transporter ATP-binding protein [Pseudomonas ficuserectae]|uniref:ABC-type spermidine/putrescine transport system, ATPase component n=1 Tax=Pseudomonas amygdali pv. mori TaxID=34065 RepID=A0A0P9USE9_PSEA0|nr:ABC transporter ATP-binding protein [Pseudomonas ficuserectae]KPX91697.1 ABC-type spermidine/putrescine transport system, ATPase component [Pseudomonas amygdali pv. mori]